MNFLQNDKKLRLFYLMQVYLPAPNEFSTYKPKTLTHLPFNLKSLLFQTEKMLLESQQTPFIRQSNHFDSKTKSEDVRVILVSTGHTVSGYRWWPGLVVEKRKTRPSSHLLMKRRY